MWVLVGSGSVWVMGVDFRESEWVLLVGTPGLSEWVCMGLAGSES